LLEGYGNFFCLAKWQTSQIALLSQLIEGYKDVILDNLLLDKWPKRKCHKALLGIMCLLIVLLSLLQDELEKQSKGVVESVELVWLMEVVVVDEDW
jgi:hypothetical protein